MTMNIYLNFFFFLFLCSISVESKAFQRNFHSDVIVTHWPTPKPPISVVNRNANEEENQPGFWRQQLIRFGEVTSKIGNAMGSHASKITNAIDKICEVIKTIIPVIAAVCHVGQFKFCAASTEGPSQLSEAMNPPSLDLDSLDK